VTSSVLVRATSQLVAVPTILIISTDHLNIHVHTVTRQTRVSQTYKTTGKYTIDLRFISARHYIYIYIYIYMCVCVCECVRVCVWVWTYS
jgi:hypothetical protein